MVKLGAVVLVEKSQTIEEEANLPLLKLTYNKKGEF